MSKHLVLYYITLLLVVQAVRCDNNSDVKDEQKAHSRDEEPFNQRGCPEDISSEKVTTPGEEPPEIPHGGDIWQVSNYTQCILISRKMGDSWDRRCFPGNNENDYLKFDTKRDCRLMNGICYSVHREKEFLQKYFSTKPTYILPCIILKDECFVYDRYKHYMLETNRDECYDSFCHTLKTDPENPENLCNGEWDCGRSLFNQEGNLPRYEETDNSPFPGLGEDATYAFKEGLQTIMRENNFQGKPTGRFYSIVVLNNGSVSVMFSSTNNTQQRSSEERNEAVGTSAEAGRISTEAVEKSTEANEHEDQLPEYTNPDNLWSYTEYDDAKRSVTSSLPVFLSHEKASHLLQALKEVLPENMLDENPSAIIYSVGVLFENSEPEKSEMKNDSHENVTGNGESGETFQPSSHN